MDRGRAPNGIGHLMILQNSMMISSNLMLGPGSSQLYFF